MLSKHNDPSNTLCRHVLLTMHTLHNNPSIWYYGAVSLTKHVLHHQILSNSGTSDRAHTACSAFKRCPGTCVQKMLRFQKIPQILISRGALLLKKSSAVKKCPEHSVTFKRGTNTDPSSPLRRSNRRGRKSLEPFMALAPQF